MALRSKDDTPSPLLAVSRNAEEDVMDSFKADIAAKQAGPFPILWYRLVDRKCHSADRPLNHLLDAVKKKVNATSLFLQIKSASVWPTRPAKRTSDAATSARSSRSRR